MVPVEDQAAETVVRTTRRRAETRERLLDAAFSVFASKGFGRTRIEDICQASGYTKGAFYSNFDSLDGLFLALYRQHSQDAAQHTLRILAADSANTVEQTIKQWAEHLPISRDWLLINTDFVLYAARNPAVQLDLAAERTRSREEFTRTLAHHIAEHVPDLPPSLPTPSALARALVTVYDGAITQLSLDLDEQAVRKQFISIASALIR
jgi:AcrR family transcriptional regulator